MYAVKRARCERGTLRNVGEFAGGGAGGGECGKTASNAGWGVWYEGRLNRACFCGSRGGGELSAALSVAVLPRVSGGCRICS
eukprot:scaffold15600_cov80-Isochrysis_galbana.AAC.2